METTVGKNLKNAKNIGATILKRLNEIGIYSLADLAEMTPVKAYIKKYVNKTPKRPFQFVIIFTHWKEHCLIYIGTPFLNT